MSGVLVLGGEGMLGHKMFQLLSQRFPDVKCTVRRSVEEAPLKGIPLFKGGHAVERVDVMDWQRFEQLLRTLRPAAVVNCIGIIKQRAAADDPLHAIAINALFPHLLATWLADWGGRLVHFSTDCVFSGRRGGYTEDDPSDAEDVYGKTKFLGEVHARNAVTLRTSIVGRELAERKSLLEWFLQQEGGTVRGFRRVTYTGVTTNHLAQVVGDLLDKHRDLHGLFQVTGSRISKHDLLVLLRNEYRLNIDIVPDDGPFSDRSLNGGKFRAAIGYNCPPWPELVAELVTDPTPYSEWWQKNEAP